MALTERCGLVVGDNFNVGGVPLTVEDAQDLGECDSYRFQKWVFEQVGGLVSQKGSVDGGTYTE